MDYSRFTIVLPTLNEGDTIGELIGYLLSNYGGARVIVVDDGSTDKTGETAMAFASSGGAVAFYDRKAAGKAKGLTASIVDGILQGGTDYVVVMDADLQHPPEVIAKIASILLDGYALVVANRASVGKWPLHRRLISKALMLMGRAVLASHGSASCKDIFSGYFGVRREIFVATYTRNGRRFVGEGYKALFDFLKCNKRGSLRIADVDYSFAERRFGSSKAGLRQGVALLRSFLT